jgi:hypothetical protein
MPPTPSARLMDTIHTSKETNLPACRPEKPIRSAAVEQTIRENIHLPKRLPRSRFPGWEKGRHLQVGTGQHFSVNATNRGLTKLKAIASLPCGGAARI